MTRHFVISFVKSLVRIGACCGGAIAFAKSDPILSRVFVALTFAEILGVMEEIGE